ncbi:RICIN domain-containing protein [Actinoalloteichus hymeniacidonis]|uniref:Carbohydrate-binding protein n=1 Tax=Actinoalloteichus hymeniacidonis TaxID=340345 RepID=A0AAC9N0R3_9PSEU|nr:RICIN domain-containing protein [Actinoalloteichus hymeniacidonis]AOS65670.1 putative carbohydrate-binding protein [Actinoalloteichus hymeniacidonis]MBB5906240.1 hypothetical protein [Actinoalloteichus hymeniacidonis]
MKNIAQRAVRALVAAAATVLLISSVPAAAQDGAVADDRTPVSRGETADTGDMAVLAAPGPEWVTMYPKHTDSLWTGNQNVDRCADVADNSQANGARVILWDCAFSNNQQWAGILTVDPTRGDLSYMFANRRTGKCMDVADNSMADGARVIQYNCHNGWNQQWEAIEVGDFLYQYKNRRTGKCLDVADSSTANGSALVQWTCHSGANQQWTSYIA